MHDTSDVAAIFQDARSRLRPVPQVALGSWRTPKRFGIAATPRIEQVGSAWHVGVLLIADDFVATAGTVTRSVEVGRRGYVAESARSRDTVRAAAHRGRIPEGTQVHIEWQQIDLRLVQAGDASGPLTVQDGIPVVLWSTLADPTPLAGYLQERIDLLLGA